MKNIFVSSTFRDFQFERDILHRKVLPKLNSVANLYGDVVSFCDLRWGVDTSEATSESEISSKVLDVCLEEIDRSHPYMLIFLGERYGFAPGKDIIEKELNRKNKMLDIENIDISITALEIEYGALSDKSVLQNTFFYFREMQGILPSEYKNEDDECKEKLNKLKQRIIKLAGDKVNFYKASYENDEVVISNEFETQLIEDFENLFKPQWKEIAKMNSFEKEMKLQRDYMEEKAKNFFGYKDFAQNVVQSFDNVNNKTIVIKGASGAGKSTLISKICKDMEDDGYIILPFFSGITSMSTNAYDILNAINYTVKNLAYSERDTKPEDSTDKAMQSIVQACNEITNRKKLLIAVDALDQLAANKLRDTLEFLPIATAPYTKILVSCLEDYKTPEDLTVLQMPTLKQEELSGILESNLAFIGKRIPKAVKEAIVKKESAKNPLYIYYTLKILTLMDKEDFKAIAEKTAQRVVEKKKQNIDVSINEDMESFTTHYLQIVNSLPNTLDDLAAMLLQKIAEKTEPYNATEITSLIGASRHGLTERHLEVFVRDFSRLMFAQYTHYISELFMLRDDGRWDFLHKSLRQGAQNLIKEYNRSAFDYGDEVLDKMLKDRKENADTMTAEDQVAANVKIVERMCEVNDKYKSPYAFSRNAKEPHSALFILFKNLYKNNTRVTLDNPVDAIAMEELTYHSIMANEQYFLVEYIAEVYDDATYNDVAVNYLAKDLVEYSMQDGGEFLKSFAESFTRGSFVLNHVKLVAEFFSYKLIKSFGSKLNELKVKANVLESCASLNDYLVEYNDRNCIYIDWLLENYTQLVDTYEAIGGDENIKSADETRKKLIDLLLKDIGYQKQTLEETQNYETQENLRYLYNVIGNNYNTILNTLVLLHDDYDTIVAIEYSESGIEFYKKSYEIEADSYIKFGIFNLLLACSYLYTVDSDKKDFDKALETYSECEEYLPYDVHFVSEITCKYNEAQISAEKAWVYRKKKEYKKALELYEKSIVLVNEGFEILGKDGDKASIELLNERLERSQKFIDEIKAELGAETL